MNCAAMSGLQGTGVGPLLVLAAAAEAAAALGGLGVDDRRLLAGGGLGLLGLEPGDREVEALPLPVDAVDHELPGLALVQHLAGGVRGGVVHGRERDVA